MLMIKSRVLQLSLILAGKYFVLFFFKRTNSVYVVNLSTILVEPNCQATVTDCGDIRIAIEQTKNDTNSTELDLIKLSIFQNRFMSIAEQCGR